jgi:hypothetical protein
MATVGIRVSGAGDRAQRAVWTPLPSGSEGEPFERPSFADRSVQVTGLFGAGGALAIEGSNDGASWFRLTDPQGAPLSFSTAGLRQVQEVTLLLRPRVTGGDATTALTVTMLVRV